MTFKVWQVAVHYPGAVYLLWITLFAIDLPAVIALWPGPCQRRLPLYARPTTRNRGMVRYNSGCRLAERWASYVKKKEKIARIFLMFCRDISLRE